MPHFLTPLLHVPQTPHRLVNLRTGGTVATTIEPAFDSASRRRGLLGREGLPAGTALAIAPCWSVHTFGMAFPIDVVFVRRDGTVTKVCPATPPFRVRAGWGAFATLEFAAGGAGEILPGDTLQAVQNTP